MILTPLKAHQPISETLAEIAVKAYWFNDVIRKLPNNLPTTLSEAAVIICSGICDLVPPAKCGELVPRSLTKTKASGKQHDCSSVLFFFYLPSSSLALLYHKISMTRAKNDEEK